jgi:ribonucleotide reductase alpha subunit
MAIAPTATISNICGVAQSIEPAYQNLYVKSNMSGDFTVVNEFLVRASELSPNFGDGRAGQAAAVLG